MKEPRIPDNEVSRLRALQEYNILDTPAETSFDEITALAARIIGVKIALVSLVDQNRQWFKSCFGLEARETPRSISFCGHAIHDDSIFEIPDARADERFADNPLVTGAPHIRFYAGVPLKSPEGLRIGTLCVIHTEPKTLSPQERDLLQSFSRHVVDLLELKKKTNALEALAGTIEQSFDAFMTLSPPVWTFDWGNPATLKLFGVSSREEFCRLGPWDLSPELQPDGEKSSEKAKRMIEQAMTDGSAFFEWCYRRIDGTLIPCTVLLSRIGQGQRSYLQAIVRDISKQKALESQLVEAQSIAKIGSWTYDLRTGDQIWSDEHYKIFEIPPGQPKEILHKLYRDRIHPEDLARMDAAIAVAVKEGSGVFDHRVVLDGGKRIKHVQGLYKLYSDEEGHPMFLRGTCRDRTQDIENEERYRRLLEENRFILDTLGIGVWTSDLRTRTQHWDKTLCSLYGINAEEKTATIDEWQSYLTPASRKDIELESIRIADGANFFSNTIEVITARGEKRYLGTRASVIRDGDGRAVRLHGINWDRTKDVEIEERYRKLHEENRFVLDTMQVGVWTSNFNGTHFWDKSMCRLYGLPDEYRSGVFTDWLRFLTPESQETIRKETERFYQGENEFSNVLEIVTPAGERRYLRSRGYVTRDEKGTPVSLHGMTWNATKEVELEKELERERSRSLHTAKLASIGHLAAGVGHEINNPLAIISGSVNIIDYLLEHGDPSQAREKLSAIEVSIQRISNIVKGLRTFARSDTSEISDFDPFPVVRETVDLLKEIYAKEGIEIVLQKEKVPATLKANRGRLQQVLVNLLSNARDATAGVSGRRIEVSAAVSGDEFHIVVKDNGRGIPKEIQDKIFDPFFTTKPVNEGTGLGLSIVNTIIKEQNGKIDFTSSPGQGTEFRIIIPIVPYRTEAQTAPKKKNPGEDITASVLIVDDEPELRNLLAELLTLSGSNVKTASGGREALEELSRATFDLVLSDIRMPGMDGLELFREMRKDRRLDRTKFIFITGGVDMSSVEQSTASQADGTLYKPVKIPELLQTIRRCLS